MSLGDDKWVATITEARFGYTVTFSNGVMGLSGTYWRSSRAGAERLAQRRLRRLQEVHKSYQLHEEEP